MNDRPTVTDAEHLALLEKIDLGIEPQECVPRWNNGDLKAEKFWKEHERRMVLHHAALRKDWLERRDAHTKRLGELRAKVEGKTDGAT